MLILTILLSIAFAAGFTLLPARVQHRKPACADGYAGAGVTALVWLWAVCIWSRPGLTADFDGFRLAAILAMQGLSCGIVCGFRLRGALPKRLRAPAAVVLLLGGQPWGRGVYRQPKLAGNQPLYAGGPAAVPDK